MCRTRRPRTSSRSGSSLRSRKRRSEPRPRRARGPPAMTGKRHVLLGVGASVAIHRALDLASELRKRGHDVTALMTPGATRLVSALQFAAITGRRVLEDVFSPAGD